jgi:predicted secreted protein
MTTEAQLAQGTLLQRWVTNAFVTIAEIVDIGGPALDSDDVDVTNHDSPGGWEETISGLKKGGEVKFSGNFIPSNVTQQRMVDDQDSGDIVAYRILENDAAQDADKTAFEFDARVKSVSFKHGAKDVLSFEATLKINGKPTLASDPAPNLSALTVTGGTPTWSPTFVGTVYEYMLELSDDTASVTVTPTCASADAIYVNDVAVTSGAASGAITITLDVINTIVVKVTDAGCRSKFYTLHVYAATGS